MSGRKGIPTIARDRAAHGIRVPTVRAARDRRGNREGHDGIPRKVDGRWRIASREERPRVVGVRIRTVHRHVHAFGGRDNAVHLKRQRACRVRGCRPGGGSGPDLRAASARGHIGRAHLGHVPARELILELHRDRRNPCGLRRCGHGKRDDPEAVHEDIERSEGRCDAEGKLPSRGDRPVQACRNAVRAEGHGQRVNRSGGQGGSGKECRDRARWNPTGRGPGSRRGNRAEQEEEP